MKQLSQIIKPDSYMYKCPNCKKPSLKASSEKITVEVNLDDIIDTYEYCGRICFEQTLEKLNSTNGVLDPTLKIVYKEKTSIFPEKWLIICKTEFPEIKML